MNWLLTWFRNRRIQRLKARLAGLDEVIPALQVLADTYKETYYIDRLLESKRERGEVALRLLFLLEP